MSPARRIRCFAVLVFPLAIAIAAILATHPDSARSGRPARFLVVETQANDYTYNRQQTASVDIDAAGRALVVWGSRRQEAGTSGIFARLLDSAGRPIGGEIHVNEFLPENQVTPAVSFSSDQQAWVVWQSHGQDGDSGGIIARRLGWQDRQFRPLGGEIAVNQTRSGNQRQPVVSCNEQGEAIIAWTSQIDDRQVVMGRVFRADGKSKTDELVLSGMDDHQAWLPVVADQPGDAFVVVWAEMAKDGQALGIFARRFATSGIALGDPFRVNPLDERIHVEPSVDADAAGRFVVTWMRSDQGYGYEVCGRRFDRDGAPLGDAFVVADRAGGWKSGAAVAVADDGRFVVSYNLEGRKNRLASTMRPVTPADVMARLYGADGRPQGRPFRINDHVEGRQALAIGSNARRTAWSSLGQLAFAWQGDTQDDHRGVGLTLLVPKTLVAPPARANLAFAAEIIDAERVWGENAQAPPVFDPNFVLEPPDQDVHAAGEDFGFLAIQSTGWNPPDPDLAVGPGNIVCVVNGQIAFFDKNGVNSFRQPIAGGNGFWGEVGATSFVFDPVALFDPHSGRYIVGAVEHSDSGQQVLLLAVSIGDDPNDGWHKYRFDVSSIGGFIDFPNLGVGLDAVYFAADFFSNPTGNHIFIIPKEPVLNGDPVSIDTVRTSSGVRSLGAVKTYDVDAPAQYFVTAFTGAGRLTIEAIRDPLGEPVRDTFALGVPPFSQPPDAEQQGSPNRVDTIDVRIKNGAYRNGSLWVAHTVGEDDTARARWYEIEMNGWPESGEEPTLRQTASQDLGQGVHNWFADINVDAEGNMAIAFNRSSATEFVSIQRAFRTVDDPLGTLRDPVTMQVSTSPEQGNRWGDYSGLEEDPAEPGVFWSHTEYRTNAWRTWVGRIDVAATLPQLAFVFPDGLPTLLVPEGGDTVRVEVSGLHNGVPVPGTGMLHYNIGEEFVSIPMDEIEDNVYDAVFPAIDCGTGVAYFFSAETVDGELVTDPLDAPDATHLAFSATGFTDRFTDDFETDQGWTVENINLPDGAWERGVPAGGGDRGDPPSDFDGSGSCYVTDNADGNSDVDGGPTRLISPAIDLTDNADPFLTYARWFTVDNDDEDRLEVEISNDNGGSWVLIESVPHTEGWVERIVRIRDFVEPTRLVKVRFSATDSPNDSVTEAAIDAFTVFDLACENRPPIHIVHGNSDWDRNDPETWVSFNDHAFGGYIDPKVESTDGVNLDLGLNTFNVVFNTAPFGDAFGGPVTPANVTIEQTGGVAPNVTSVTRNGNTVTVELDRIITLQEWTTVVFDVFNADGVQIIDTGNEGEGVDEDARLDVGALPSDVNNDGAGQPLDLTRWISSWNGGSPIFPSDVERGHPDDYLDISRGGGTTPLDLSREIAALKGQAPFTRNWRSVGMNAARP